MNIDELEQLEQELIKKEEDLLIKIGCTSTVMLAVTALILIFLICKKNDLRKQEQKLDIQYEQTIQP